jgi:hypothetical protein
MYNPLVTKTPNRLFEICDLDWYGHIELACANGVRIPLAVTSRVQCILKREWTTRVPLLQARSPASLAALILHPLLESGGSAPSTVVDFCSGAGGPVPAIAHELNALLAASGSGPVRFLLTDLRPNLASWREAQHDSGGVVGFVAEPVDATLPLGRVDLGEGDPGQRKGRVFGLYCLAFHHFGDDAAKAVLHRTMDAFDGFAIVELQDRRLSSLVLMAVHLVFVLMFSVVWFWRDPLHLLLTYVVPVFPTIMLFDGCVSALRTREFPEVMALIDGVSNVDYDKVTGVYTARRGEWRFQGGRRRHTLPFGYINWVTGHRAPSTDHSTLL